MHDASRARQHGEGDAAFTEEMEAAIQDLGPNSAAVAFIYLWCRAGRREADVTGLLDRVAGLMPESTWRGARKRLFDRGYLTAHRTPSGEFYTITAQPASCTRVAPDPQREFGFCRRARDPDGAQPASHPPSTVPLHGTRHAAEGEPAGPGARDLREIRADLAPPPNTKELARIPTKTKNQEPRIGIGGARGPGAESARNPRGSRGPVRAAGVMESALADALDRVPDLADAWRTRDAIIDWIVENVPEACPIQAGYAADCVLAPRGNPNDLHAALQRAREIQRNGKVQKSFAAIFFGSMQWKARLQGFTWPRKPR